MLFRILSRLLLLGAVFGGAFYVGKIRSPQRSVEMSRDAFLPTLYPLTNRFFTIVIVGYNNGAYLEKTLRSAFFQNYSDYRIVYIDDASTDGSFDLARDLIYASDQMLRTTLVQNEQRLGVLENLARAVETCQDHEIVVVLGGEDWLAHEWVLQRLNQYYENPDLWMSYGQYREYPQYSLGLSRPMPEPEKPVRQQPFFASHLKTFYASLFKQISIDDFTDHGVFYQAAADFAYMLPMLEMAGDHAGFIPDILYIANRAALMKEDRETALRCEKSIRSMAAYEPLQWRVLPQKQEALSDEGTL